MVNCLPFGLFCIIERSKFTIAVRFEDQRFLWIFEIAILYCKNLYLLDTIGRILKKGKYDYVKAVSPVEIHFIDY